MVPMQITIPLDPRTKKNHMQIAGSGPRCPTCKRFLKQFVKQGRAYDEYASAAAWYCKPRPPIPIDEPVTVTYRFYMRTRRVVDQTGLIQAMDDILVANKILKDDNSRIVKSHDGTRVLYDKENPRTEIVITPYREEDDKWL